MKRRNFVRSLLVAPAGSAALKAQQQVAAQKPSPSPATSARRAFRQPQDVPKLDVVQADLAAEPAPRFFTATQFATLQKLASLLVPPLKGKPSAIDAQAPEFLDFLIRVSSADRQKLYCAGLDSLNIQATEQFHTSFAELNSTQADTILRPLFVARPWPEDFPDDHLKNFIARAHEDLRTATTNSREWANSGGTRSFGRGFSRSSGYYWRPIDPVTEL